MRLACFYPVVQTGSRLANSLWVLVLVNQSRLIFIPPEPLQFVVSEKNCLLWQNQMWASLIFMYLAKVLEKLLDSKENSLNPISLASLLFNDKPIRWGVFCMNLSDLL
jgi:hypothetical protein